MNGLKIRRILISLVLLCAIGAGAWWCYRQYTLTQHHGDWPHWRGPNRDDLSPENGLAKSWPAGGPKLLWHTSDIGVGYTAPAIFGQKLFTGGGEGKRESLFCLDARTGHRLWAAVAGDMFSNDWGNGPRGTPAVNGDQVYFLNGRGNLTCTRIADGKLVWQKSLRDLEPKNPRWGHGESVLVDGKLVLCTPGGAGGLIAAFDKKTGQLLWQSKEVQDEPGYSSIAILDVNGERQYVQITKDHVVGVSAQDGKLRWQHDWPGKTVIPTPIVRSPYVYVSSGQGSGCMLLKIGPQNVVETIYQNKVMKNMNGGVVLVGDYLYGHSDPIGWVCQKFLSGEQVWAERGKLGEGPVTYADGMLYCLDQVTGEVALVKATPDGWNETGRFKLDPQSTQRSQQGRIWTHPVVSHGKLYLRDQEHLYCYDVRGS